MTRLVSPLVCVVLVSFLALAHEQPRRPPRQLPSPTDIDPKLTEEFRQLEQEFCDAVNLNKNSLTPPCTDLKTQKSWSVLLALSSRYVCPMVLSAVSLAACGGNRPAPTRSSLSGSDIMPLASSARILRSLACSLLNEPPLTAATEAVISMSWTSGRRKAIAGR